MLLCFPQAQQPGAAPVARQVPLITGGSTAVTANSLLMVKVMPSKVLPSKVLQEEIQQLEAQYRRVVDGQNPVPWLAQRGVLQTDLPCKFCRDGRALLQPDTSAINGYSLRCRRVRWVLALGVNQSFILCLHLVTACAFNSQTHLSCREVCTRFFVLLDLQPCFVQHHETAN
ncbi:uncharacterized protein LOC125942005 [Dermacentor silvarum]|uniref:uncharacterized protein LOC125942005 n=1 Tax=Dermacentor silvarum TaxID=543639 RepID=UPI0021016697|nr:uncharacterized protein LOC125942005 [Dermacentor silvarum]